MANVWRVTTRRPPPWIRILSRRWRDEAGYLRGGAALQSQFQGASDGNSPRRFEVMGSRPRSVAQVEIEAHPGQILDADTFVRLEKLSRKAASDALRALGYHSPLTDDQFDALAIRLLDKRGVPALRDFDPGLSVSTGDEFNFAYRQMRGWRKGTLTDGPTKDWLRRSFHDRRFEPETYTSVTETGNLPEHQGADEVPIHRVAERLAGGLAEREAWTLRHVASAIAEGRTLVEVVEELLADLADALRPQMAEAPAPGGPTVEFFETWLREAA